MNKNRQYNGQKKNDKRTNKIYKTLHRNTNPTKNQEWSQVLQKGKQYLLHMWHPSCKSCYKPGDKSHMLEGGFNIISRYVADLIVLFWMYH